MGLSNMLNKTCWKRVDWLSVRWLGNLKMEARCWALSQLIISCILFCFISIIGRCWDIWRVFLPCLVFILLTTIITLFWSWRIMESTKIRCVLLKNSLLVRLSKSNSMTLSLKNCIVWMEVNNSSFAVYRQT